MDVYEIQFDLRPGVRDVELVESAHHRVNSLVVDFQAALYRDFPDPHRQVGEERV